MTAVDEGIKLAQHLPKGTIYRAMADEIVKLRAQLAGVRERVLQLDRYGFGAPDVVLSRVVLGDVLAALGGDA